MPPETLIDGYTFFVTAAPGRLGPQGGLFHRDTRYLSAFDVSVTTGDDDGGDDGDLKPLGETLVAPNERVRTAATASTGVNAIDEEQVPKHADTVVERRQRVRESRGYVETITVHNHAATARDLSVTVGFDADFADLFEVRGVESDIERTVDRSVTDRAATLRYAPDADPTQDRERTTSLLFDPGPDVLTPTEATFGRSVPPQGTTTVTVTVAIDGADVVAAVDDGTVPDVSAAGSSAAARDGDSDAGDDTPAPARSGDGVTDGRGRPTQGSSARFDWAPRTTPVTIPAPQTGRTDYDAVFERAAADLAALTTETEQGPVPLAGTPWFATPFGRDAILTAHQTLAVAPDLAAGTLRYFAAHRGTTTDAARREAPGKVFHEIRHGELAATGRIPHTPYFGTVDATPLWVLLLAEVCRWRDDRDLARELAVPLAEALEWTRRASAAGDDAAVGEEATDGTGPATDAAGHAGVPTDADTGRNCGPFVYYTANEGTLTHNAWKDTADSIRFADGDVATGELAVAEVQGYAAAALTRGGRLLEAIGRGDLAPVAPATYRERGRRIEAAFDREFWLPDRSCYALARDGTGRVADAVASNVGHCLWTGTIPDERAAAVAETLVDGPLNSSWGLRTMSPADAGYSPVSYHAGGVWPHDTSLVAMGLAEYGFGDAADDLARGVLDAATHFDHDRLPELYCGFGPDRTPTTYPAACTPQAWAAGAPFAFLRASFRATPADDGVVRCDRSSSLFDPGAAAVFVGAGDGDGDGDGDCSSE